MKFKINKLVHVILSGMNYEGNMPIPHGKSYNANLKKNIEKQLENIARQIKKDNTIKVSIKVVLGVPHKEICSIASEEEVDIIVMGTHGVSGVSEFFVGSNASKVVASASCPVITIQKSPKTKGFKNIILPIRSEFNSRQKVDYVVEMASLFSATILVTGFADKKDKADQAKMKQYVKQVEKYLAKLKMKFNTTILIDDNFTKAILVHATKNKADLIAIMNEHDFSLDQIIKGPYAKQFVNHSHIPIFSIPVYSDPDMMSYSPYMSGAVYE
jgi:nucleotide-binding universal stress UspA family protein